MGSDVTSGAVLSDDGTIVYVGTASDGIFALDSETGSKLWNYTNVGSLDVRPTLYQDLIIAPSTDGYIYAFDTDPESETLGGLKWQYPASNRKPLDNFDESGVAHNGFFYIGNVDGNLHGVTIATGARSGTAAYLGERMPYYNSGGDDEPSPLKSAVVKSGDDIYFGNDAREIIKYTNNRTRWVYYAKRPVRGEIAATEDIVIATDRSGAIYALNPDEREADRIRERDSYDTPELLWREYTEAFEGTDAAVIGGPVISGAYVYVIDHFGVLYMIDLERGKAEYQIDLWEGDSPCRLCKSGPAVEGDMLFAGTQDGTIVGIQLPIETE